MKALIFTIVIGLSTILYTQAQDTAIQWYSVEEAQAMQSSVEKPIFVDFTAVWCGWCKKMDQTTFSDEEVAEKMNASFYPVKLDIDSPEQFMFGGKKVTAKELAQDVGITGLPTMVVFDPDLSSHELIVGYQKKNQFLGTIEAL
ncbi:Thioredoxin-like domain-containing protein [Reichenbachiella agariperforans]|uniref:Thioredoxin-like domain-containing protein n=1 Tax=Reichenbachiella agariperforans TaxID=156994 RepID=A0A1M6M760_REIAG|nr:thioredoxin family protein [Reichenbachiella agariperforans]SHJ79083.1 Thioredoxin-like domain-containing protein [Reichenbachiella agariperforans]